MSGLTREHRDAVLATCQANLVELAKSYTGCFGQEFEFSIEEPATWDPANPPPEWAAGGAVTAWKIEDNGAILLIPDPLPEWVQKPNDSEQARLNTLPMEWSLGLFPEDLLAEEYNTRIVRNLGTELEERQPQTEATLIPITLKAPGADSPEKRLHLIFPVELPLGHPPPPVVQAQPEGATGSASASSFEATGGSRPPLAAAPAQKNVSPLADNGPRVAHQAKPQQPQAQSAVQKNTAGEIIAQRRIQQILKIRVPVIVKLAQRKLPIGQLKKLGPGVIVQFDKSFDDLLDLCVNNQVYCQGEAVKIGEKFGLKVNKLGPPEVKRTSIIDA